MTNIDLYDTRFCLGKKATDSLFSLNTAAEANYSIGKLKYKKALCKITVKKTDGDRSC